MPTLLDLITPHLGGQALDPPLRDLLGAVQTQVTTLPPTTQVVGSGPSDVVWRAVRGLFPVPSFDASPFAVDPDIDARSLGRRWTLMSRDWHRASCAPCPAGGKRWRSLQERCPCASGPCGSPFAPRTATTSR